LEAPRRKGLAFSPHPVGIGLGVLFSLDLGLRHRPGLRLRLGVLGIASYRGDLDPVTQDGVISQRRNSPFGKLGLGFYFFTFGFRLFV
jgi:hypothetical protein